MCLPANFCKMKSFCCMESSLSNEGKHQIITLILDHFAIRPPFSRILVWIWILFWVCIGTIHIYQTIFKAKSFSSKVVVGSRIFNEYFRSCSSFEEIAQWHYERYLIAFEYQLFLERCKWIQPRNLEVVTIDVSRFLLFYSPPD